MTHEFTLHYDEHLLRRAVLRFWWRVTGLKYVIALAISAAGLFVMISQGDRSWLVGFMATALAVCVGFAALIYVVHFRNAMQKFRDMGEPEAQFTADEESFSMASGLGTSTLKWRTVTEVWQFKDFWLMFFSKAQFVTLPLADITPAAQAFILERVQESGGKVR